MKKTFLILICLIVFITMGVAGQNKIMLDFNEKIPAYHAVFFHKDYGEFFIKWDGTFLETNLKTPYINTKEDYKNLVLLMSGSDITGVVRLRDI